MKISNKEKNSEKRDDPRIEYSGNIFFISKNRFYEGDLTNYSDRGLFIRTSTILPVGTIVTLALPYLDGHVKRRGQVIRANLKGFGIELFKEDPEPFEKVTPREMKIKVK